MKNHAFARPINDGEGYESAPVILPPSPHAPTEAQYNAEGWYRKAIVPPTPPAGKIVSSTRYAVEDNKLVAVYTYEDAPIPVKRYNKYRIVDALMTLGIWPQVKAWLMTDEETYDRYQAAEDISGDEELLAEGIALVKENFGLADEQIADILERAEM